jgi:quercetin dioxygenase-like cupin family protein
MPKPTRRLVVGGGESGLELTFDEYTIAPAVETEAAIVHEVAEILPAGGFAGLDQAWHHDPDPDGAIFRIVSLKPPRGATGDRPLHSSVTIDVGVVLSGQVVLALPGETEATLSAGDSFVLRGVEHAWLNQGPDECVLAVILLKPAGWLSASSA